MTQEEQDAAQAQQDKVAAEFEADVNAAIQKAQDAPILQPGFGFWPATIASMLWKIADQQ